MDISGVLGGSRVLIAPLSWTEYRQVCALNPSTIVHGRKSMKHLKWYWDHGQPDTEAMLWGRAVHCLLFEAKTFQDRYCAWEGRRQGKDYENFVARAFEDGMEVMKAEGKFSLASAIEASLGFVNDPIVQGLIREGRSEVGVFAVEHGLQCKGRIDRISPTERCIVDVKTTADVGARAFGRDFYKYGYDIKLGLYRRWLEAASKLRWGVEVIAIENVPPYDVAVIPIADAVLDRGMNRGLEIIGSVKSCIHRGVWPGVAGGDRYYLDVPSWEMEEALEGAEEVEG